MQRQDANRSPPFLSAGSVHARTTVWLSLFAIDARSLAAFRIAVGAIILIDLARRAAELKAFYSDAGVLPLDVWRDAVGPWRLSLHAISGNEWFQYSLVALTALSATMLLLGYRTRIASVVTWALMLSMHSRNTLVINRGDELLAAMLFWSMFLPLGGVWSLDARLSGRKGNPAPVSTIAAAAILIQVAAIYVVSGLLKTGRTWFPDGTAMWQALSNTNVATHATEWILPHESLLRALTFGTLALEVGGPIAVLACARLPTLRFILILVFWAFHLGTFFFIRLGMFPFICMSAWLLAVPSQVWDRIAPSRAPPDALRPRHPARLLLLPVLAYCLVMMVVHFLPRRTCPEWFRGIGLALGLDQRWTMYAPNPPNRDVWIVAAATTGDGGQIDLARGGLPVTWDRPDIHSYPHASHLWRKYLMGIWDEDKQPLQQAYLRYLVREWNRHHAGPQRVREAALYYNYDRLARGVRLTGGRRIERARLSLEPDEPYFKP